MRKLYGTTKGRIIIFMSALLIGLTAALIPTLAASEVKKPVMVKCRETAGNPVIYTSSDGSDKQTGYHANGGNIYRLYKFTKSGYCGIYYYDKSGNTKIGYCVGSYFVKYGSRLGVDVSHHQGNINWYKVSKATVSGYSVDYAIIKLGQTSSIASKVAFTDSKFKVNMEGAYENGLMTGVYFYSKAKTASQARNEAEWVIDKLESYDIDAPVAFDYEDDATSSLSDGVRTEICLAFLDKVRCAGYKAVLYSYQYYFKNSLTVSEINEDYDFWVARYHYKMPTFHNSVMWQFTSSGSVSGISGNVDMNWWYTNK